MILKMFYLDLERQMIRSRSRKDVNLQDLHNAGSKSALLSVQACDVVMHVLLKFKN